MKRNQRSATVPEGSFDGSFNLAATVGQGEGQGCYMPAVQSLDRDLQQTIREVTIILHTFYRLVVPRCTSKFEWDVLEFHSKVNNVFGFGGFEPGNTGLQMNVSSGFTSLAELIGEHQGALHTDQHDHPPSYTVCTICFNLPPSMYDTPWSLHVLTMHSNRSRSWPIYTCPTGPLCPGDRRPLFPPPL